MPRSSERRAVADVAPPWASAREWEEDADAPVPRPGPSAGRPAPPATPALRALLRRFPDAGRPLACTPVAEGLLNHGYRLTTTRGTFFLKHHLDGDHPALARRHRAVLRLEALGLPVAPPLVDGDGGTLALLDGHCFALHPWVEGSHLHGAALSPRQCARLGVLLGLVHLGLRTVMDAMNPVHPAHTAGSPDGEAPAPGAREGTGAHRGAGGVGLTHRSGGPTPCAERAGRRTPQAAAGSTARTGAPPAARRGCACGVQRGAAANAPHPEHAPSAVPPDPARTLREIEALLALVGRSRPRDSFDELAEHRLRERRALLELHAHRRPAPHPQPVTTWVHGDFHPLNLLYQGPEPAAILDWDRLGVQPRAEEAVRAAAIFFVRPCGALDLERVRAYATAYRAVTAADAEELAHAVHRVWWERLNDFWTLQWRYRLDDRRADPLFPAVAALAVWWTRRYEAVREAFCG